MITYLQKNSMTFHQIHKGMINTSFKQIHKAMVNTFGEDFPSYSTVKKWAAEFKLCRDSTEDVPWSVTLTTDEQVDTAWFWMTDQ